MLKKSYYANFRLTLLLHLTIHCISLEGLVGDHSDSDWHKG